MATIKIINEYGNKIIIIAFYPKPTLYKNSNMQAAFERIFILLLIILVFSNSTRAQNNSLYSYRDLSEFSFANQKDSLKKAWNCPQLYKDKETQKKYKELWNSRTDFITSAIDADDYIKDGTIYNYLSSIVSDLVKANPHLVKQKPLLLIDRSPSVNAYALGENVIAVNLGMITFAKTREELALAIAHELSHNILNHAENSMENTAVWLTSDEFKNSMNSVLDSKYERLTRLKKVLETFTFDRSRHSRYHESDADSLAVILLKNSHISFDPEFFLRLDSTDDEYQQPLKNPVKSYFTAYNVPLDDVWFQKRSKGLSSHTYNFHNSGMLADSLKTHPGCVERYNKTKDERNISGSMAPIPSAIKEKANKILIWNIYDNQSLTECLYRILLEKDKGNTDPWYDFMMYNVLQGLYYSSRQLNRFNAVGIKPKEYISKDYYELQTFLEQIPSGKLEELCKAGAGQGFWSNMPADAKGVKMLFDSLNSDSDNTVKTQTAAAKQYLDAFPYSMYCEFAEHFKK